MKRYEIQTQTFCDGFVNMWTDDNEEPITWATRGEAYIALTMHLSDDKWADPNNYRIAEVAEMKTHELTGADLNDAVAKCLGIVHTRYKGQVGDQFGNPLMYDDDWSLAGEIIERERLLIQPEIGKEGAGNAWSAIAITGFEEFGPTPLIAAMRCYVASKEGEQHD